MTAIAKSTTSLIKKNINSQKIPAVGVKKIFFAHKSPGGETTINVNALVAPDATEVPQGWIQPNISDILNARMYFFRNNVRIISSVKGTLIAVSCAAHDYTIKSSSIIELNIATTVDEVFHIFIEPVVKSSAYVVDTDPVLVTGTLTAGVTDINIGKSKKILDTALQQGAVSVEINGQTLMRNVGNATAAPAADGNYEEVSNGNGEFTLIRLNVAYGSNQPYIIRSTALDVIRPDGSVLDQIESQQATIDIMVEDLALVTGNPTTNYQAAPTAPQLKQFGDRVVKVDTYLYIESGFTVAQRTLDDVPFSKVQFNTTGAVGTLFLPPNPARGYAVLVSDSFGTFGSFTLTIDGNGNNINGAGTTSISVNDSWAELFYNGTEWRIRA